MKNLSAAGALAGVLALAALASAAAPALTPVDAAGLKKEVAKRKGKVVVMNFWATWCGPCKAEFPDLVAVAAKNRARGVELVTVAFDDKDDYSKASAFLAQNKVAGGTLANKNGADFDMGFLKWLEPNLKADAAIAIPRTYIFARNGKLVKVLVGSQRSETFQAAIDSALAVK